MPRVSVVIAAYGNPSYLNQALQSVEEQSYTDYELIVVDDCSGDEVVSHYRLPQNATLIRHERRFGAAAATRNSGIRAASGELLALLDQDDIWLPQKLERQVEAYQCSGRKAVVYCHTLYVDDTLQTLPRQGRIRTTVRNPLRKMIGGCFIPTPSTVLATLEGVGSCGMFDESIRGASDWDFYLRMLREHDLVAMPERLVLYRMHKDQLHRKIEFMNEAKLRVMQNVLEWSRRERPQMENWVRSRYARVYFKIAQQHMDDSNPAAACASLAEARKHWVWSPRAWVLYARASVAHRRQREME